MRTRIQTPKKPNSARRPVAKVFLSIKKYSVSHIPGIGHNLRKHSSVLVCGGGARDLPGVRTTMVRGVYDFLCVQKRFNRRSIYGIPRPIREGHKPKREVRKLLGL